LCFSPFGSPINIDTFIHAYSLFILYGELWHSHIKVIFIKHMHHR